MSSPGSRGGREKSTWSRNQKEVFYREINYLRSFINSHSVPLLPLEGRKPKKDPEVRAVKLPGVVGEDQSIVSENNNNNLIDSYTIEWDESDLDDVPVQVVQDVQSVAKVIKKKMIWDPHTKVVVSTESEETAVPSPPKKKRSEVDKLLGDEGVQTIMRDQQIALDDNGLLVNIQKASKTRHQRSRQEEPDKTPNDWNVCSMIVRRRSSVSSTESQHIQMELEPQESTTPPKITDLFQTMKAKINQSLQDNFDSIVVVNPESEKKKKEKNNNVVVMARKVGRPPKQATNGKASVPLSQPPITIQTIKIPENSENSVFQVKFESSPRTGPNAPFLSAYVCQKLVEAFSGVLQISSCKLVLLGPIKFPVLENVKISLEDEAEQRNLLDFLARFPKPIIVAQQGHVEGVGVTMLPLFDLVFAKYGTEFCCATDPLPGMSILMSSAKVDKNRVNRRRNGREGGVD